MREFDVAVSAPPVDDLIEAPKEVRIRQDLALVALGKRPADKALRVGRLLDVHTRTWREDWEIVIKGRRIAWVGPSGEYQGEVAERFHEPGLSAVPGFGEVHKHIESSHLTPEWEAALVLPRGNTWTCEASHEFSNVNGPRNLEFWLEARKRGSPLKIFPLPGSAVPPTAYEWGGGYFGRDEQRAFMAESLMVAGLDEVMDWPAVWNPENPSYERLWGMIEATFAARGVVEGHASGLRDAASINAFAAAGLASDHEVQTPEETWDKLARGLFIELRIYAMPEIMQFPDRQGPRGLVADRLHHRRPQRLAHARTGRQRLQCAARDPERPRSRDRDPMRHDQSCAAHAADAVRRLARAWPIRRCRAALGRERAERSKRSGRTACKFRRASAISAPRRKSPGRTGRRRTINIQRELTAEDFALAAEPGRNTMKAAVIRPFHWHPEFYTMDLPVRDGEVQRDPANAITKFAIVDRFSGEGESLEDVLARLRPRDAGDRARLFGRARQAQYLERRLLRRGDGEGGQRAQGHARRLGAGARGRTCRDGAVRNRRPDVLPARRKPSTQRCSTSTPRRARSIGCTSRPSARAGIPAFPNG